MLGKLTLDAVPYHEPIIMVTVAAIIVGGRSAGAADIFRQMEVAVERMADFGRP